MFNAQTITTLIIFGLLLNACAISPKQMTSLPVYETRLISKGEYWHLPEAVQAHNTNAEQYIQEELQRAHQHYLAQILSFHQRHHLPLPEVDLYAISSTHIDQKQLHALISNQMTHLDQKTEQAVHNAQKQHLALLKLRELLLAIEQQTHRYTLMQVHQLFAAQYQAPEQIWNLTYLEQEFNRIWKTLHLGLNVSAQPPHDMLLSSSLRAALDAASIKITSERNSPFTLKVSLQQNKKNSAQLSFRLLKGFEAQAHLSWGIKKVEQRDSPSSAAGLMEKADELIRKETRSILIQLIARL